MKNKSLAILGLGSALLSSQVHAAKFEVEGDYLSSDVVDVIDITGLRIGGKFYFKPLKSGRGPLEEAAFLQKSSHLKAEYYSIDWDFPDGSPISQTQSTFTLGGAFIHNDWLVGGSYQTNSNEIDSPDPEDNDVTVDVLTITGGRYIDDNWLASFSLVHYDFESDTETGMALETKRFIPLNSGLAVSVSGKFSHVDEISAFSISGDLYINKQISVGLSIHENLINGTDGDTDEEITGASIRAQYFINDKASVKLSYTDNESFFDALTNFTFFEPTLTVSGKYRF